MVRIKKRRKLVFDKESTHIYAMFLNYRTLDEARADVPKIARALKLSPKAVGGHLTQCISNSRVGEHLFLQGYLNEQIPYWFARPQGPPQPQTETHSITQTQPSTSTPNHILPKKHETSQTPNFSEQKQTSYVEEWWRQSPSIFNELDLAKLPPESYTRTIWSGDETQPKPRQEEKTDRLEEPAKPEELRSKEEAQKEEQEKLQRQKRMWVENMTLGMTFINAHDNQKALKLRRETDEFPGQMREAMSLIPRQATGPSETEQMQEIVKAVTTILQPVMLPFDTVKKFYEDKAAKETKKHEDLKDACRLYLEMKAEQENKRRQRLHSDYPDLFPDYA